MAGYPIYRPRNTDSITALIMRQGEIAAERAQRSGEIWGSAINQVGQTVGGAIQQHQEKKDAAKRAQMFDVALQSWNPQDPTDFYRRAAVAVGPETALQAVKAFSALEESKKKNEPNPKLFADKTAFLGSMWKKNPDWIKQHWSEIAQTVGPEAEALYSVKVGPEWDDAYGQMLESLTPEKQGDEFTLTPGQKRFGPGGKVIAEVAPTPAKAPTLQHVETAAGIQTFNPEAGTLGPVIAKGKPQAAPVSANKSDIQETVAGMKEGTLPPQLPGRATKEYVALLAEARRQGYDLSRANLDWAATSKHLATLNGAQQTRLRQAVDTATHSLDVIEDLATQWQGGNFPMLNKARLAAAKGGALGPKAQAIATQLEAQISDVTSELGNVYMGGNSPTDHALGLAAKNLSADWALPQLKAALDLSRKNLQIRANSMNTVGAVGISENNPYSPKPEATTTPTKTYKFNQATGKLE